jgi:hypothetical protein
MDVLLHSKYSSQSLKLISQLQSYSPFILENLTLVCIDNKEIRQQILEDEKIKIKYLPCLIRMNEETSNYDIFEGDNAFQFFTNLQKKIELKNDELNDELKEQELKREKLEKMELERQIEILKSKKQDSTPEVKTPEKSKQVTFTPIEDLDLEQDGIGTYLHIEKDEQKEQQKETKKSGSIMSKAMQMQKERV